MGDWVESYLSDDDENSRREMRLSDLALQGALSVFKTLAAQVESDINKWEARKHCGVRYEFSPSKKFAVRSLSTRLPYALVEVELLGLDIVCTRTYKLDSTCSRETSSPLRFRISSDLVGNIQITDKGNPIEDESELSEKILRPFFDYVGHAVPRPAPLEAVG
jgi:hypothetical protein